MTGRYRLREFKIEVTHRCNLACIHCSGSAGPSRTGEVAPERMTAILREAAQLGASKVDFSGGEPLLWPGLEEAISHARELNMDTSVYSSGNVDDPAGALRTLKKHGAQRLVVSLFGGRATTHDWVTRVPGSFAKSAEAVQAAVGVGVPTELHFVPMKHNWHELSEVCDLGRSLGARRVSVLRLVLQGRGALLGPQALGRRENVSLRDAIRVLRAAGHDIRTGSPYNFLMLAGETPCNSGVDRVVIDADLRVFPCDALKGLSDAQLSALPPVWHLVDRSLRECWEGSPFLNGIREYLSADHAEPCRSCKLACRCGSGCLAQKVRVIGNLSKEPDPMCLLGKGRRD